MARKAAKQRLAPKTLLAWLVLGAIIAWLLMNWPGDITEKVIEASAPAPSQETTETTATESKKTDSRAEVIAETLNFRSRPEYKDRTIIKTLTRGMTMKVLKKEEGWLFVELDTGQSGYVADGRDFVRTIE